MIKLKCEKKQQKIWKGLKLIVYLKFCWVKKRRGKASLPRADTNPGTRPDAGNEDAVNCSGEYRYAAILASQKSKLTNSKKRSKIQFQVADTESTK